MKRIITICLLVISVSLLSFEGINKYNIGNMIIVDSMCVRATIYKPYKKHNITADGFKFDWKNAGRHRIIAVSRDLLKKYPFGSKVLVTGVDSLSGIYEVRDLMAAGIHKRIDILVDKHAKLNNYKHITIFKLEDCKL